MGRLEEKPIRHDKKQRQGGGSYSRTLYKVPAVRHSLPTTGREHIPLASISPSRKPARKATDLAAVPTRLPALGKGSTATPWDHLPPRRLGRTLGGVGPG